MCQNDARTSRWCARSNRTAPHPDLLGSLGTGCIERRGCRAPRGCPPRRRMTPMVSDDRIPRRTACEPLRYEPNALESEPLLICDRPRRVGRCTWTSVLLEQVSQAENLVSALQVEKAGVASRRQLLRKGRTRSCASVSSLLPRPRRCRPRRLIGEAIDHAESAPCR